MKFFQEITVWDDGTPNHVYMLSNNKEFMFGYVRAGTTELLTVKTKYRFDVRRRKFKEVANTFGYVEPVVAATVDRWEVAGSKGNIYIVEREDGQLKCSCSGFTFRGKCRHIEGK